MKTYPAPKRRNLVHLLNRLRNAPTAISGQRRPGPSIEEFDELLDDEAAPALTERGGEAAPVG